jgi:hypothetical protein
MSVAELGYVTERTLTPLDLELIGLGVKRAPGVTHALTGDGEALCLARHFATNPYGGGRSRGTVYPLGRRGAPICTFCRQELA